MFRRSLSPLRGWRAGLAAAALGAISAAALPPYHVIPVLLITVPGLLVLIDSAPGLRAAAWRGFWFGFGHHMIGLYWVTEAILIEAARYWWLVPFAVPGLAALLAPFIAGACAGARLALPGWRRLLVFAGAWALFDLARQFVLGGFPWNPWGSVWAVPGAFGNVFIQPVAWIGTPGLTLATVLLAGTPYLGRAAMALGAAGLALWAGLGVLRLRGPAPATQNLEVVLVQGDIQEGHKLDQARAMDIFNRHLALTREGVAAAVRRAPGVPVVVIWPETASPFLLERDALARQMIMRAAQPAVAALVGAVRFDNGSRPRNTLFALTGGGAIAGMYDKWHLVPFGEYQPWWIFLPIQIVPGGGFQPGPGPETLTVPNLPPFGAMICYEAVFPGEMVDEAHRPDWLVNITNDAWFGNSSGPRQHLAAARMRTVEEGLPLMRAANTGISAGFDARGRELGRLPLGEMGVLELRLPGALPPTVFSRWALWLPTLLGAALLAAGLARRPARLPTRRRV